MHRHGHSGWAAPNNTVTPDDIVEVIAGRAGASLESVKRVLEREEDEEQKWIAKALTAQIWPGLWQYVPFLAGFLANCSDEEAQRLAEAIRTAKFKD